jgi:hypothetical protein
MSFFTPLNRDDRENPFVPVIPGVYPERSRGVAKNPYSFLLKNGPSLC